MWRAGEKFLNMLAVGLNIVLTPSNPEESKIMDEQVIEPLISFLATQILVIMHIQQYPTVAKSNMTKTDSCSKKTSPKNVGSDEVACNASSKEISRDAILHYLTRVGIIDPFPSSPVRPGVDRIVRDYFSVQKFHDPKNVVEKHIRLGLNMARTSFAFIPCDKVQAQIAKATALGTLFDDAFMGEDAMNEMLPRFFARKPQLHPMLDCFIETMTSGMQPYFSDYSANAIGSSFLEFCNSETFLRRHKQQISFVPDSSLYIEYMRMKDGFAEAFAAFIWPECICPDPTEYVQAMPDAMAFGCLVNDVLSYYKEATQAGDDGDVMSYAKVHNITEQEAIVRALVRSERAREAWEGYVYGLTHYHFCTERYKLQEIIPDYC
ncbi:isoprenoid synthase domain-containing protein [Abortiporus biennis]|nr:isoprenoid synthase domain-containing protein [Abortiporus biennis]